MSVESNETSMMPSLLEFFNYKYNFDVLKEFLTDRKERAAKLSVGLLDWFNVNYSKEYGVEYVLRKGSSTKVIYVWQIYNAALSGYTKQLFDPYGRGKSKGGSIKITNEDGESINTTLAQLNYFRWAIKNGVIDYVKEHLEEIYDDLSRRSNRGRRKAAGEKKHKLSVSASKTLGHHDVKMTIKFGLQ